MSEIISPPLQINNLHKRYGQHSVLKGVNLEVTKAAVHGLVGLNGAGKTTAMQCMLGLQSYSDGNVSVLGKNPKHLYQSAGKVAAVFDEPCLHPYFSVEDVLRLAQVSVGTEDKKYRQTVMQRLGIERYCAFKIKTLSLGNRRRTAIAQALITRPQFVVLDEPFNGLDAAGVDDVLSLITRLNQEEGITFLLASHQLPYLETVCTHMSILHQGLIVQSEKIGALLIHEHEQVNLTINKPVEAREFILGLNGVRILKENKQEGGTQAEEVKGQISCELLQLSSAELNRALVEAGFEISELLLLKPSLEHLFRNITGELEQEGRNE